MGFSPMFRIDLRLQLQDARRAGEATTQGTAILERIRSRGMIMGTVMNPGTSVSSIENSLKHSGLEMVVIMLENSELGGSRIALNQIKEVKDICRESDVPEPYIISLDEDVDDTN